MQPAVQTSKLPRWVFARRAEITPEIAAHLAGGLYSSLPIFLGGVINSVVIAAIAAARHPTALFLSWVVVELIIGISRLLVVAAGNRALKLGNPLPVTITAILACAWAASVGFGAYLCIASEDWVLASITCLSTAAMVSGICLRNFGTPRLVAIMMVLTLVPCALAALHSRQTILLVMSVQLPIYMVTIGSAASRLNRMMVSRMLAQDALEKSEAFNRSILESSPDYTLLLDENHRITFCNRPGTGRTGTEFLLGTAWLDLLPPENRAEGKRALAIAQGGETARLTVAHSEANCHRWFDLAVSRISDGSGRIIIVARDVTHQKSSEERAIWMASHDPLTELPNRVVLQANLDGLTHAERHDESRALLVLDIDGFKLINDTLGHDAGDALLCEFGKRLRSAVRTEDLVARLGGDEFAIVLQARSDDDISIAATKIFEHLQRPFEYLGHLIDCNLSIGACLFPRDGTERSELLKAADIALYSAKKAGRAQLKIFHPAMRNAVQARNSTMFLARRALSSGGLLPFYQPKVSLRNAEIVGFEALLRWRDAKGNIRLPEKLHAAFEDHTLAAAISKQMIDAALSDIRVWLDSGLEFGHVAINVSAAEFRSGRFASDLLEQMQRRKIAPNLLQIEVTETVFLGRGADHVGKALRQLSRAGLRIALDDFGTGFASLSHLMQFPVDALKIDKSFVKGIGRNEDAEAIIRAIVNLGHSLGVEIIAEGVENAQQEHHLVGLGCHVGQGFLYSKAVPAETVGKMLLKSFRKSA